MFSLHSCAEISTTENQMSGSIRVEEPIQSIQRNGSKDAKFFTIILFLFLQSKIGK